MRRCNECKDGILCTTCNNQINENKEIGANLNELKRQHPNQFGHMLPYFKEKDDLFIVVQFLLCFIEKNFLIQ